MQITVESFGLLLHMKDCTEELSPKEAHELIHKLQDGLFDHFIKYGRKVEEPVCEEEKI